MATTAIPGLTNHYSNDVDFHAFMIDLRGKMAASICAKYIKGDITVLHQNLTSNICTVQNILYMYEFVM